ncbi:MAG: M20/M25/M40 family metallo-hydrolase [Verrucomicrobia bacterium]|nr:M20/M25/M40 family metallo-hydrolase [Verrucomicrobiota bacterium]
MQTLSYLSDVIGPRLTASPNLKRANEWTRGKLESWGLTNAHLEAWGPFGRGWSLKRFSAQVIEPQAIPLIAFPKAWSPGLPEPLTAEVVWLDAKTEADLDKYKGKLNGAIVLAGPPVEVLAHWTPQAARMNETNLLALANAPTPGASAFPGIPSPTIPSQLTPEQRAAAAASAGLAARRLPFATKEGAALIVDASRRGDGGTMFLASASVPNTNASGPGAAISRSQPWATNTPAIPPQVVLAAEHYNRLVRLIQAGEKVKMSVELQVQFHNDDLMAYNTVAEIPGTDLKDEIVMLGAHMDSWHSGTGATDNGCGVAVCMEAVRILQACGLKPRRTIRVGLWTGEEQGLFGSKAYVRDHFGTLNTITITNTTDGAKAEKKSAENAGSSDAKEKEAKTEPKSDGKGKASAPPTRSVQKLTTKPDYEKFAGYFNLDNGSGKIRGIYMQGNDAVRPVFRKWLAPFKELGADTLTPNLTGGTDHLNFDAIGLPGFQFIQDDIEYFSRTHHSNMDVFDRAQADDLKQASVIMAAFVYNTAMRDEKLPRKPAPPR